jgi:hypothetical protein
MASSHLFVSGFPLSTVCALMFLTLVESITITVCLHSTRQFSNSTLAFYERERGVTHQPIRMSAFNEILEKKGCVTMYAVLQFLT